MVRVQGETPIGAEIRRYRNRGGPSTVVEAFIAPHRVRLEGVHADTIRYAYPGEYVVTWSDGEQLPVTAADFTRWYEPMDDEVIHETVTKACREAFVKVAAVAVAAIESLDRQQKAQPNQGVMPTAADYARARAYLAEQGC